MTLNEIASIIDSDIRSGLKGVTNFSYSIAMLEREVSVVRNRVLANFHKKPGFNISGFTQAINCIKVDREKLSKCPIDLGESDKDVLHFQIPMIELNMGESAIDYIGPPIKGYGRSWKVYFDESFTLHQYKPATKHKTFVYIDPVSTEEGMLDGFILNYRGNLKNLSFRGILTNPEDAELFDCHGELTQYPAPDWCNEEVIRRLTEKYLRQYRQLHAPTQNNDQTDKVS